MDLLELALQIAVKPPFGPKDKLSRAPSENKKPTAYRHIKQVGKVSSSLKEFPFSGWLEGPATELNHQKVIQEVKNELKAVKSQQSSGWEWSQAR